jgi:predicted metalloendopeptidase
LYFQLFFFNLKAEDAVKLWRNWSSNGHEIGHGFDDQGSTDGEGVMKTGGHHKI